MTGLVEFVTARLDEAEAVARAATSGVWKDGGATVSLGSNGLNEIVDYVYTQADLDHVLLHQPAAVLRDVEATRKAVECYEIGRSNIETTEGTVLAGAARVRFGAYEQMLRAVASRWSTHPD